MSYLQALKTSVSIIICSLVLLVNHGAIALENEQPTPNIKNETEKELNGPATLYTPKGATFELLKGFSSIQKGSLISISDSDESVDLFILEMTGTDCKEAVKAIWSKTGRMADWTMVRSISPPSDKDFDEFYIENYRIYGVSKFAQAVACRKGNTIWVSLKQGTIRNLDKRRAQLQSILSSLQIPGMKKMNLANKTPRSIKETEKEFTDFINKAIKETKTPGLAIAVIENNKVIYANGFGVRKMGEKAPVTPETLMMIGSVTKSLTTFMIATLIDNKKLYWTDRVIDIDPTFKLGNYDLTNNLLIEHMFCACAGLPREDMPLVFADSERKPGDVFAVLSKSYPSTKLKETFQYQNQIFAAGGYIAAKVFDKSVAFDKAYDKAMEMHVFRPMGMESTTLDFDVALNSTNRATPHSQDIWGNHQIVSIDAERFVTYLRPSGGIWSNVRDMAKYAITELNKGISPQGQRVVSKENLTYRWEPQVKVSSDVHYGLGWMNIKYKGLRLISHGGGTRGFATSVNFFPEKGIGAVMISNGTGGHTAEWIILKRLFELWFNVDEDVEKVFSYVLKERERRIRDLHSKLSAPENSIIKPMLGIHNNDEIGDITLYKEGNAYFAKTNSYSTKVLQYLRKDGRKLLRFSDPPLSGILLNPNRRNSFTIYRAQKKYIFIKVK